MKIKKFRVKNFRSIKDSGDIYLEDKITILAGKNESGKTALLHALADFDTSRKIRTDAKPIDDPSAIPEVSAVFLLSKDELARFSESLGIKLHLAEEATVEIIKASPNNYTLERSSLVWLDDILGKYKSKALETAQKQISDINKILSETDIPALLMESATDDNETMVAKISEHIKLTKGKLDSLEDQAKRERTNQILEELGKIVADLKKKNNFLVDFQNLFLKSLPSFVYFDAFDNLLPYTLPLTEVNNNQAVKDFFSMAGIDLNYLLDASNDFQQKKNHLSRKSATINGDFLGFWKQDKVELIASLNADQIVFGFREDNKSEEFRMDQRSKGFQWFLSFYIKLKLHQDGKEKYLLIDEPGLYLHAKAQIDVLQILESISKDIPIIFSTHSPYLLEYDNLPRVKLVFKDKKAGTIVASKYHKISDRETLRPILTAIGLEITSGITNPDKLNNVIVEGASDWYYLSAFKKILGEDDLNFIYGGGATNMPHVGTILQGWGCKVLYLFDNDQGGKDGERVLANHWMAEPDQIKFISKEKRISAIEDLFTKDDFKKYVLDAPSAKYDVKNSEYAEDKDKVIKAKIFHSKLESIANEISDTTKKNFAKVIEELKKEFE